MPNRSHQPQLLTLPNAFVERVIGSIRRECLDHVIVVNATGLQRVLTEVPRLLHAVENASRT